MIVAPPDFLEGERKHDSKVGHVFSKQLVIRAADVAQEPAHMASAMWSPK